MTFVQKSSRVFLGQLDKNFFYLELYIKSYYESKYEKWNKIDGCTLLVIEPYHKNYT